MARRRTTVTATIFDAEGYPFISLRGSAQDVGDAAAIYVMNISNPLGGTPLIDIRKERNEEEQ